MKFCFGDIVVVEEFLIGVVVKSWIKNNESLRYEVYVRDYNNIIEYKEEDMQRYMVRHKELNEEEVDYQKNAINPFIPQEELSLVSKCLETENFQDYINYMKNKITEPWIKNEDEEK